MKKYPFAIIPLCVLLLASCPGCRKNSPSRVVEDYLRAVESGDIKTMKVCLDEASQVVAVLAGMMKPENAGAASELGVLGERLEGDCTVVQLENKLTHVVVYEFILRQDAAGIWKISLAENVERVEKD